MKIDLMRQCPICGSEIANILDDLLFEKEEENCLPHSYNIVSCSKCGFTFADMKANQKMFDDYYSTLNIYSQAEDLRGNIVNMDSPYFEFIYKCFEKVIDKEADIVDVGFGGGQLLDFLCFKGFKNLSGLDPSVDSVNAIKNKGYSGIVSSIFDDIDAEYAHRYDLVISTMVAEHVYDLNKYVKQLQLLVKNEGYIFITVPDVAGFKDFICPKANYFNQEHINYFSKDSMTNLFEKYGLCLVNEECNRSGDEEKCLYMLFRQSGRMGQIKRDTSAESSITEYLRKYSELEEGLKKRIKYVVDSGKQIVVWGSGQYAKQIIRRFPELLDKLLYFVDNNTTKYSSLLAGKTIKSPQNLIFEKDEVIICICSMKNSDDIKQQLDNSNITSEVIVL